MRLNFVKLHKSRSSKNDDVTSSKTDFRKKRKRMSAADLSLIGLSDWSSKIDLYSLTLFSNLTENFVDIFRSISYSFSVLFFGIPKTLLFIKEMPFFTYKIESKISQIGKKSLALESMVFCAA